VLKKASELGWNGICVAVDLKNINQLKDLPEKVSNMEVYKGVVIPTDVEKNARKALDQADIIIALGGVDEANRQASECWEVDMLVNPELTQEKDHIDYKKAGIDNPTAAFMKERGIALGLDFSRISESQGRSLALTLGRIRQNVRIALKYKIPVVLTSGAREMNGLRTPVDLAQLDRMLGIPQHIGSKIVSEYPETIVKKMKLRNNPNVITKGLEVLDWGKQKPQAKRKYGWY
jgi:ribonuclease P/MRP protein subunit RPP1